MNMKHNQLLFNICLGLAAYWSLGWYVPGVVLSVTLSVFSVLVGIAIVVKYFEGWSGVLFRGDRSRDHAHAHLGAIGIPAIAASVVYGGVFTLFWNLAGNPPDWLGTPTSNFSRLLLVGGCVALYLTPDDQRDKLSLPSTIWLMILLVTAMISAFLLGAYVNEDRPRFSLRASHSPECPASRPLWAATGSRYYHGPESPWRALIHPRGCFETEDEAQMAGFIPAPRLNVKKLKKPKT